jgi:hypothetical protein
LLRLTNAIPCYAHRPAAIAAADPHDPPEAPPPLPCLAWGPLDKQQQQQNSGSPRAATATAAAYPRALLARGWGRCVQLLSVTLEPTLAASTTTADTAAANGIAAVTAARTPTAAAAAALQGPTVRLEVTRRIETDGRVLAVEWLSSSAIACVVQHCELRVYDVRSGSELERCSLAPLTLVRTPLATAAAGADSDRGSTAVKRVAASGTAAAAGASSATAGEHKAGVSAERSSSDASTTSTAATTTAGADADNADSDSTTTATTAAAAAGDVDTGTNTTAVPTAAAAAVAASTAAAVPAVAQYSCANCIRAVEGRLYTLGTSRLRVARVQDWQQRVSGCIAAGEWLEALAVALDHYEESSAAVRAARQPGKLCLCNHPTFTFLTIM